MTATENNQEEIPTTGRVSLEDVLEQYFEDKVLRPATVRGYRSIVRIWRSDCGISYLDEVTPDRLREWKAMVMERSSATNWNSCHRTIRAILNHCVKSGLIPANPMNTIQQSSRGNVRGYICPEKDLRSVVEFLRNNEDEGRMATFLLKVILTLYFTGMRRSQLCGLNWGDVNFTESTILLRKEHSKTGREWPIPMHPDLKTVLLDLHSELEERLGRYPRPDEQVFWVQQFNRRFRGDRLTPDQVSGLFKRLSKRSGIRISPHPIRHLVASTLANQHVGSNETMIPASLATLRDMLGHADIGTTVRYIESNLEAQRKILHGLTALRPHVGIQEEGR